PRCPARDTRGFRAHPASRGTRGLPSNRAAVPPRRPIARTCSGRPFVQRSDGTNSACASAEAHVREKSYVLLGNSLLPAAVGILTDSDRRVAWQPRNPATRPKAQVKRMLSLNKRLTRNPNGDGAAPADGGRFARKLRHSPVPTGPRQRE